jgi:xanthosine utilization system XapX-like protein
MLLLAKLAALTIGIWFYMTADKVGEPPAKWVIIGLIGYLITWFIVDLTLVKALTAAVAKKSTAVIVITQIPAVCGLIAAYFIRNKLLSNLKINN